MEHESISLHTLEVLHDCSGQSVFFSWPTTIVSSIKQLRKLGYIEPDSHGMYWVTSLGEKELETYERRFREGPLNEVPVIDESILDLVTWNRNRQK